MRMTKVRRWAVMLLRDKFARRWWWWVRLSRLSRHDDACQKQQRAGRDDADSKDGKKHDLANFLVRLHCYLHTHSLSRSHSQNPHLQPRPVL